MRSAEKTGGKEKKWTDCVQSDIRAFGIAGAWKVTALEAEVWFQTVTEGERRFTEGEVDATPIGEVDGAKEPCTSVR